MKLTNSINTSKVLNDSELDSVIKTAFKILENTGFIIENNKILIMLENFGARVDQLSQKIFIGESLIQDFLSRLNRKIWGETTQVYIAEAEIYNGYFLDPADNQYKTWTHELLLSYIKLAEKLSHINGSYMLGCPIAEVPVKLQPLYEKLYCWKYGIRGGEGIWDIELCEPIYTMHEIFARSIQKDLKDVFHGVVYLISPLKLGSYEAEQVWYFYERGIQTSIRSGGGTLGGTFPVTIPGALSVCLAENLGFNYQGHSGLSDSKLPGFEAASQKIMTAMYNASVCGTGNIVAGLLGADEIFSPIQMILENELTGALNHICRGLEVNEETLAYNAIKQTGPGGNFLSSEHTAIHFENSLWKSSVWSDQKFNGWRNAGEKNDIDLAKEMYLEIINDDEDPAVYIDEETEKKLTDIIRHYQ